MVELRKPLIDEAMLQAMSAVTDRTRLEILFLVGEQGRMCVGDIAGQFRISRPAISHHLKVLKNSSSCKVRRWGKRSTTGWTSTTLWLCCATWPIPWSDFARR